MCKLHTGYKSNSGYGLVYDSVTQKTMLAHRKAFRDFYGYLPPVVMHKCDTPLCIDPEHLQAGTQSDNIKDMWKKGRVVSRKKLNETEQEFVRLCRLNQRLLAKLLDVHQRTIWSIKNGTY